MNAASPPPTSMPLSIKFAFLCLVMTAMVFFPFTVLLCACMLPTFVAALIDGHPQKTAGMTIGAMNMAGSMPAIFDLLRAGGTLNASIEILLQPKTLLFAYGTAMIGWMLYYHVPKIVAEMLARRAESRIRQIDARHKELVRKWGDKVTGNG